jgi:cytidylate kinase
MPSPVITIARTLGAHGEDVGQIVAEKLGYRYADDEIISAASARAGVSKDAIERSEHRQGLIGRILETMAGLPMEPSVYYVQALSAPRETAPAGYDELIRDVIIETANQGKVIIVAHGAGICLAKAPGVLRVFVTASEEIRTERLAQGASVDIEKARKAVHDSDLDRADFLKRFYGLKHEDETNYDLVVNTDRMSAAQAAALVLAAAAAA